MDFNKYQYLAMRTSSGRRDKEQIATYTLGVSGEAGEIADLIKKWVGHGHDLDKQALAKEIGDVLWYLAVLAECFDMSLDDIATINIEKLKKRYPEGSLIWLQSIARSNST